MDPRHGRDWLERAILPVVAEHPDLGARVVRGALWRSAVNAAFMDDLGRSFGRSPRPPGSDELTADSVAA